MLFIIIIFFKVCGGINAGSCFNTDGSYSCNCNDGYKNDDSSCEDINECLEDSHSCESPAYKCENKIGGYDCICEEGYVELTEVINSETVATCVELKYDEWSEWTSCSPTIDENEPENPPVAPASKKRTRDCSIPGITCLNEGLGAPEENKLCPKWGEFSEWTECALANEPERDCQNLDEQPTQFRIRTCENGQIGESGCDNESDASEEQNCDMNICCKSKYNFQLISFL